MYDSHESLNDRLAIEKAVYLYAYATDNRDFELMRTLFCADAQAALRDTVSGREQQMIGAEAIIEFVDQRHAEEAERGDCRRHLTSNFVLESCDGKTAVARSYVCVLHAARGQTMQFTSMGHYEDHLRKEDGHWRFYKRMFTVEGKGPKPAV